MASQRKRKPGKPQERFYLFPGQGGKNYHRKQRVFIAWAVVVALLLSAAMTAILWWASRPKH